MPRAKSDYLTGERNLRLRIKVAPEELELIAQAAQIDGQYRDTWARDTLVREARKCAKRQGPEKK